MSKNGNVLERSITSVSKGPNGNTIVHVDGEKLSAAMTSMDYDTKEMEKAQSVASDLLEAHWAGIQGAILRSGDGIGSVSLSLKLDHTGPERELKAKIAYSVKTSDEIKVVVRDPRQPELGV